MMKKLGFLLMSIALFAFACAPAEEPASETTEPAPEPVVEEVAPGPPTAMVTLHNAEGEEIGTATFVEGDGGVTLKAIVTTGVPTGKHGFHVHEFGECTPDFKAAGGHFNPKDTPHGCPDDPNRHAGDFGNIEITEGGGMLEVVSDLVTVTPGPTSLVGKAVIVHAGEDMCPEQPTGAAGARLACGVIHLEGDKPAMAEADAGHAEGESHAEGEGHDAEGEGH